MEQRLTKQTIAYMDLPERKFDKFGVGDMIVVAQKIKDSSDPNKDRIQNFQGTVIAITNRGISSMFTVRKMSANGVHVERIFPFYAPFIDHVKLVHRGKVRRAKLYYVRHKVGKKSIIQKLVERGEPTTAATVARESAVQEATSSITARSAEVV